MSQKQKSHSDQYHYVNTLGVLPEDDDTIPSNVTIIEDLNEAKSLDSDEEECDEKGEEPTTDQLKVQFFNIIAELQRQFPTYSATDFKHYLDNDAELSIDVKNLKNNFNDQFKDVDKTDPEYINLLIGLSSIGVEIPKNEPKEQSGDEGDCEGDCEGDEEEDEGDKCDEDDGKGDGEDDELNKSIIELKIEETDV